MNKHSLFLFVAICWLTALNTGFAQSFLKFYDTPPNSNLEAQSVFQYPNGDFGVSAVQGANTTGPGSVVALLRTDASGVQISLTPQTTPENAIHYREQDGSVLSLTKVADSLVIWKRNPAEAIVWRTAVKLAPNLTNVYPFNLTENEAGEVFANGFYVVTGSQHYFNFTAKFASNGAFLWKNTITTNDYQYSYGTVPDGQGGCLSGWPIIDTVFSPNGFYHLLTRYLPDGSVAWHHKTYPNQSLSLFGYGSNDAGQSLIVKTEFEQTNDTSRLLLLGPSGDTVWQHYLNDVPEMCQLQARVVLPIGNNGFYVLGTNYLDNLNQVNATVARVNADGSIAWVRSFPNQVLGIISLTAGHVLADGSLIAAGTRMNDDLVLLRLAPDGNLTSYQNTLEGKVVLDNNDNCLADNGEPALQNWVVTAQGPEFSLYTLTDAMGHYRIPFIDTGAYQVYITPPSFLWQSCPDTVHVYFAPGLPAVFDTANFAVQTPTDCPLLQVKIAAPNFRRCTNMSASATICNWGASTAIPAQLRLVPDPMITLTNFSYPHTMEGDTLVFTFDSIPPLDCRVVVMTAFINCNVPLGQTLCMEGLVSPDSICGTSATGNWSGANIQVAGRCDADSVRLSLANKGLNPTTQPVGYVIIDDHVITREGAVSLQAGELKEFVVPANGHTWRITATQEPGYPMGEQAPTIAVEGCTTTGNSTTGMVNLFDNNSGNGLGDIFCREVIGSYDPNDKTAFPYGVDDPHCIEADQDIEYLVRFQNTGTDTAFRVEIIDTLSQWLQPSSIRPGTASHPYSWKLSSTGILSILFDGIMLPDSNVNEPASNGFVTFRIAQKTGNPVGAVIYNQAAIYFDQNDPVLTNTPYQTVCKDFLEVNLVGTATPPAQPRLVQIAPNPAGEYVRISLPENTLKNGEIVLRDAFGGAIRRISFNGSNIELQREGLASGVYFLEILENNARIGVERVVWK